MNISTVAPLPRIPLAQTGPLPVQVRPAKLEQKMVKLSKDPSVNRY